jgi:hypothetical protein
MKQVRVEGGVRRGHLNDIQGVEAEIVGKMSGGCDLHDTSAASLKIKTN